MNGWWRRISLAATAVFTIVVTYASIYRWGMATFEGESVPGAEFVTLPDGELVVAGTGAAIERLEELAHERSRRVVGHRRGRPQV